MKAIYILCVWCFLGCGGLVMGEDEVSGGRIDVVAMTEIPDGRYGVRLELKQLDGVAREVELVAHGGGLRSAEVLEGLGRLEGKVVLIGNGVFLVQLRGKGYVATQYWVFRADGTAAIKEIPDRGEKQEAVLVKRVK